MNDKTITVSELETILARLCDAEAISCTMAFRVLREVNTCRDTTDTYRRG